MLALHLSIAGEWTALTGASYSYTIQPCKTIVIVSENDCFGTTHSTVHNIRLVKPSRPKNGTILCQSFMPLCPAAVR